VLALHSHHARDRPVVRDGLNLATVDLFPCQLSHLSGAIPAAMSVRKVVITGVSRGLGRALVEEFIAAGHLVAGCARSVEAIDELCRQHGSPHHFSVVDLRDATRVEAWGAELERAWGVPDLLLNNGALINTSARLWQVPVDEFHDLMAVNVHGTYHVLRTFLPAMIQETQGVVVNFSSGWGRSTDAEVVPYCASKWAVEGLTQGLAQELPDGMAAVALNPGCINTDMLRRCFGDSARHYPSPTVWARRVVPFLLGLSAKHNGQSLDVPTR
jgi:NAD(P)-dependent dehydrogenase (short-subunit alcohol dehydrogenase family)